MVGRQLASEQKVAAKLAAATAKAEAKAAKLERLAGKSKSP